MKYAYRKKYTGEDGLDHYWSGWVETWDERVIKTSPSMNRFQGDRISDVQHDMKHRNTPCIEVTENADPRK